MNTPLTSKRAIDSYSQFNHFESTDRPLKKKFVQVFVEANIEFKIDISDPTLNCGWLQAEVTRKYYETLEKMA
jgi:hypothetical protein